MNKTIGPSFPDELEAAGLAGLPLTWTEGGELHFADAVTPAQRAAVKALRDAHDPARPSAPSLRGRLADIDARKVRALSDALLGGGTERLARLEAEAAAVRALLAPPPGGKRKRPS